MAFENVQILIFSKVTYKVKTVKWPLCHGKITHLGVMHLPTQEVL